MALNSGAGGGTDGAPAAPPAPVDSAEELRVLRKRLERLEAADGAVWSWGDGFSGRLGHGDEQRQLLPKKVEALAGRRVVAVAAGVNHSIATTADDAVFTWGKGGHGCLGHGEDLSNQLLPKKIETWAPGL